MSSAVSIQSSGKAAVASWACNRRRTARAVASWLEPWIISPRTPATNALSCSASTRTFPCFWPTATRKSPARRPLERVLTIAMVREFVQPHEWANRDAVSNARAALPASSRATRGLQFQRRGKSRASIACPTSYGQRARRRPLPQCISLVSTRPASRAAAIASSEGYRGARRRRVRELDLCALELDRLEAEQFLEHLIAIGRGSFDIVFSHNESLSLLVRSMRNGATFRLYRWMVKAKETACE